MWSNCTHLGMNGWWPKRLRHEIKWNRTANLRGGHGNNLELDLVNEFQNRNFKGNSSNKKNIPKIQCHLISYYKIA